MIYLMGLICFIATDVFPINLAKLKKIDLENSEVDFFLKE